MEKIGGNKNKATERLMKCTSVVGEQNFCWQLTADKRETHTQIHTWAKHMQLTLTVLRSSGFPWL